MKENIKAPVTGEFPAQRTSNAENVFIWWRRHHHMWTHTQGKEEWELQPLYKPYYVEDRLVFPYPIDTLLAQLSNDDIHNLSINLWGNGVIIHLGCVRITTPLGDMFESITSSFSVLDKYRTHIGSHMLILLNRAWRRYKELCKYYIASCHRVTDA